MPAKEAVEMAGQALDDENEAGIIAIDSTPHASPSDGDANQAGSCCFAPVKPALTYGEQLALMESRGLVVPDEPATLRLLAEANFYRLRGYWLSLESDGRFREGTTFDDVWDIYTLDSGLRLWLWGAIAPIEIKLRTSFSYHVGRALGPLGHEDPANYDDAEAHSKSMGSFHRERDRALRDGVPCVKHNMGKYGSLPVWAAVEVMSMGTVSRLYGNLSAKAAYEGGPSVKSAVANDFGVKATYLVSWLRHLTYVRNICGHHNRFYNRMMTSRPKMLKMDSGLARCGKQFLTFVILMRIYEQSWPEAWSDRYDGLARILEGHGNASLTPMGFPEDWRDVLKLAATNEDEEAEDGR